MEFGLREINNEQSFLSEMTVRVENAGDKEINPYYEEQGFTVIRDSFFEKSKTHFSEFVKKKKADIGVGKIAAIIVLLVVFALFTFPVGTLLLIVVGGPLILILSPIIILFYVIISRIRVKRYVRNL